MMFCYLTEEEQAMFRSLPDGVVEKWSGSIKNEENVDAFETPHQLAFRRDMILLEDLPEVKELTGEVKRASQNGGLTAVDYGKLSDKALDIFFSCLGASGVSIFIQHGLQNVESDEDMQAVASFSHVRHGLLLSNKEFFSTQTS